MNKIERLIQFSALYICNVNTTTWTLSVIEANVFNCWKKDLQQISNVHNRNTY